MIKPLAMNPFLHRAFALPLAHWRGEVALWPTLLLTLLGLRLLLFTLGGLPSLTLDAIVFIWQVTGTLRALNNAQADRPDLFNIVAGYGTIALCLPLMIFPQLDRTTADYLDLRRGYPGEIFRQRRSGCFDAIGRRVADDYGHQGRAFDRHASRFDRSACHTPAHGRHRKQNHNVSHLPFLSGRTIPVAIGAKRLPQITADCDA